MRDISALFAGQGDLRHRADLAGPLPVERARPGKRITPGHGAQQPAGVSSRLGEAYAALIDSLYSQLGDWITGRAPQRWTPPRPTRIAAIGVDALLGRRTSRIMFHANHIDTSDEQYVTEWTEMIAGRIER